MLGLHDSAWADGAGEQSAKRQRIWQAKAVAPCHIQLHARFVAWIGPVSSLGRWFPNSQSPNHPPSTQTTKPIGGCLKHTPQTHLDQPNMGPQKGISRKFLLWGSGSQKAKGSGCEMGSGKKRHKAIPESPSALLGGKESDLSC